MLIPILIVVLAVGTVTVWFTGKDRTRQTIKDLLALVGLYALVIWFLKTYERRAFEALGIVWWAIWGTIALFAIFRAILKRGRRGKGKEA